MGQPHEKANNQFKRLNKNYIEQVEMTRSCLQLVPYIQFNIYCCKPRTTSYELQATSYELWTSS
jgi:hypothetical protein